MGGLGGFPEPLLGGHEGRAQRWSRLRLERLLHEDVRELRAVSDLAGLQVLADLLPDRIGSLLSVNVHVLDYERFLSAWV